MVCMWTLQCLLFIFFFIDFYILYGNNEYEIRVIEEINSQKRIIGFNDDEKCRKLILKLLYDDYIREEIIVLIVLQFNSFFNQVVLEIMVIFLFQKLLNWGEIENSFMYCIVGVEVVFVFMLVRFFSKRLQDRIMLVFGCVIFIFVNCWLMYVVFYILLENFQKNIVFFVLGIILDMIVLLFLVVCSIFLFLKLIRKDF